MKFQTFNCFQKLSASQLLISFKLVLAAMFLAVLMFFPVAQGALVPTVITDKISSIKDCPSPYSLEHCEKQNGGKIYDWLWQRQCLDSQSSLLGENKLPSILSQNVSKKYCPFPNLSQAKLHI